MKMKHIFLSVAAAGVVMFTSCEASVGHDEMFHPEGSPEAMAQVFASQFTYDNGSNHSNSVRVFNNTGYDCQLDYIVGKIIIGSGKSNYVDVVVPFAGNLTFVATVMSEGMLVDVDIPILVEDLDTELDPLFKALTNGTSEGKTWTWWAYDNGDGTYTYIDGSWGCFGGGGYGWSNTGPNWECFGIGDWEYFTGAQVTMDEWVKFDCNGGPNVTVCNSDGTVTTGTFTITNGTTPEKAAVGWVGTLKLTTPLPHQGPDDLYTWYIAKPVKEYDVAMLDDEHLILIAPGDLAIFCDEAWASGSAHWTFKVKED